MYLFNIESAMTRKSIIIFLIFVEEYFFRIMSYNINTKAKLNNPCTAYIFNQ